MTSLKCELSFNDEKEAQKQENGSVTEDIKILSFTMAKSYILK